MAKLLFFCLAWLFSFVSAFSHFSDYVLFLFFFGTQGRPRRLKLFNKKKRMQGSVPRKPP